MQEELYRALLIRPSHLITGLETDDAGNYEGWMVEDALNAHIRDAENVFSIRPSAARKIASFV